MGKININQESLRSAREWKRHKVQDGSNVFRILPPYGDVQVHNNYPYRKWAVAWLVDPAKGYRVPFATPLTDGEERCPVKEYQDALRDYIDNRKSMLKAEGLSDSDIKTHMKGINEVAWNIRVQHLYAYNACDKSGNVGLLELKSTAHKAMKRVMMEYIQKYGQDPTSLNSDLREDAGVWFNVTKEGVGKDTTYGVKFNQISRKDEDGELTFKNDRTPLPQDVVTGYNDLAYDLNTVYRRKTYGELKEILVYNLQLLADECPEAVLPGFETGSTVSSTDTQQVVKPSAKVTLNIDTDDLSEAVPAVQQSSSDIEDIKNIADSILGD